MKEKLIPERRKHGCDGCHLDVPTELFLGYKRSVLWLCDECYNKMTNNIEKWHNQDILTYRKWRQGH